MLDAFDHYSVFPAVSKIILVAEGCANFKHRRGDCLFAFVEHVFSQIGIDLLHVSVQTPTDLEFVKVRIGPAKRGLGDMVKGSKTCFSFNLNPPPDEWFDIQKLDAQGIKRLSFRHGLEQGCGNAVLIRNTKTLSAASVILNHVS